MYDLESLIFILPAVLIAIIFHEMAHGYVSYLLGDPTPKATNRLSFNPIYHLDIVGTLCLIFFRFGWAKPVEVNPIYYKNRKLGMVLVALAGPVTNLLIAFISIFFIGLIIKITNNNLNEIYFIYQFLYYLAIINIGLGVFNLIPIPPLDGSKVLGAILPEDYYFTMMNYERYGMILLIIILSLGFFDRPLYGLQQFIFNTFDSIINLIFNL